MRSSLAIFLVALFSVSLITPALFASESNSNLPACCRKDGKHHCTVLRADLESSGPAIRTAACADYPVAKVGPIAPTSSFAPSVASIFGAKATERRLDAQAQSLAHSSYSRAGQKRGPPAPLA